MPRRTFQAAKTFKEHRARQVIGFVFSRRIVGICAAAAMLAGCGGSEPPISAPRAVPQSQTNASATDAERAGSWMLPEAKNENLIYLGDRSSVLVYSYRGKQVGSIEAAANPGLCSDSQGDVWIASEDRIIEYAHGGTTSIAELDTPVDYQAVSCAIDLGTNDLGVTLFHTGYGGATAVGVYQNASGTPQVYTDDPGSLDFKYCAYDDTGNLYIDGRRGRRESFLVELSSGSDALSIVPLSKKLAGPGGLQWDGQYLAVGDSHNNVVYQVNVASGYGTVKDTVHLASWRRNRDQQFWMHDGVIGLLSSLGYFGFWKYPEGGRRLRKFPIEFSADGGNALSVAP
jgi:hypothetical protein